MHSHSKQVRLAIVQHGDWLGAQRLIHAGEPEPYAGMGHTVRKLEEFMRSRPHCLISLDAACSQVKVGDNWYVNLPRPKRSKWLPASLVSWNWAGDILSHLEAFRPTHLLLRTGGIPALRLLSWANARGLQTLAIFANYFDRASWKQRLVNNALARQLNDANVFLVANHRWPATETMIDCGVLPEKTAACDWPGARDPRGWSIRTLQTNRVHEILYVGSLLREKGIFDFMEAIRLLHVNGHPIRGTLVGDGPHAAEARQWAATHLPDLIQFTGRLANAECFARMRSADIVCVPSRPEFSEGFPLTLTEALASRTPVLISTHPVFTRAFLHEEGVRFFAAGKPICLAEAARELLTDPILYRRTSEMSDQAFERVGCELLFGDVLRRWDLVIESGEKGANIASA